MATKDFSIEAARNWYQHARPNFEGMGDIVKGTIASLLQGAGIDYLSVTSRTKTVESFAEKIERKGYTKPEIEMTDLCGIRVITFIEADVLAACEVVRSAFNVHEDQSLDKSDELETDRLGYRSVHFICDLGETRSGLPEFAIYKKLRFEVQVRTVLQHAWAEIEHDRSYKLSGVLPPPMRRRLYLIAGMLEIADREFNSLASELDSYAKEVQSKTKRGELDVEVDSTSLNEYLNEKFAEIGAPIEQRSLMPQVIEELRDFGINTLGQLDELLDKPFLNAFAKHKSYTTGTGFLRSAMMFSDVERYFGQAWKRHFGGLAPGTFQMLSEKYGEEKVRAIVKENEMTGAGSEKRDKKRSSRK